MEGEAGACGLNDGARLACDVLVWWSGAARRQQADGQTDNADRCRRVCVNSARL
jgi:hypothetical protein